MPDREAPTNDTQKDSGESKDLREKDEGRSLTCDVAIVGGGAAGLWLLELLSNRGYEVLLCEQEALGNAQSMASQGMIHGGIKYALGAALTGASEAISRMPQRWRKCLAGTGEVDLSAVKVVSSEYHMWSNGALGKLGSFFASRALRGRVDALTKPDYPEIFQHPNFNGTVHRLNDLVLDVTSLLNTLSLKHQHRLIKSKVTATHFNDDAELERLELATGQTLRANQFIFTAGAGNTEFSTALRDAGHSHAPATQLRPLHQAFVQHPDLSELYAHCLTGIRSAEPRLTITTHPLTSAPGIGWYIGGHLATSGVKRSTAAQIEVTRNELTATLPWIDWSQANISTLRIDRAEPRQHLGTKPDEACLVRCGNSMLCWPTKLSLVPDLGDQVLNAIDPPRAERYSQLSKPPDASRLAIADAPWERR